MADDGNNDVCVVVAFTFKVVSSAVLEEAKVDAATDMGRPVDTVGTGSGPGEVRMSVLVTLGTEGGVVP